ncbi:hypothetical protein GDO81_000141 [Engystomops pustulosus]|uniref:Uncharacterized protein n=1 Tax=Engystomops pustulosus TaxID=76066 RepID=A0AAV7D2F8_ENGPU|nr:hypothetical protein GDO81_000141 [Engystomops pustulosus]
MAWLCEASPLSTNEVLSSEMWSLLVALPKRAAASSVTPFPSTLLPALSRSRVVLLCTQPVPCTSCTSRERLAKHRMPIGGGRSGPLSAMLLFC